MRGELTLQGWARAGVAALVLFAVAAAPMAALRTAAGGDPSGENGFARVTTFINNLATYGIWIVAALAVLGLLAGAGKLALGEEDGVTWLARSAVGLGIGLCVKAIAA